MSLSVLCLFAACLAFTHGYPNGPPVALNPGICDTMMPGHGVAAMTTAAPYELKVSDTCYRMGTELAVRVTISDSDDESSFFEGFFVMARKTDGTTMSYGTFDARGLNYTDELMCHSNANSSIGHNNAVHYLSRTFYWTAPSTDEGDLQFVATVVRETEEVWMGLMTETISYSATCSPNETLEDEPHTDIDMASDPCEGSVSGQPESCGCDSIGPIKVLLLSAAMTVSYLSFK